MEQTSLKDQINRLIALQKIDAEIYSIQDQLQEMPVQLEVLKQEFESSKATLNSLEEKAKTIQVARKAFEVDLQQKEDNIAKANADLSQIKTNKEYTAKIKETEGLKADKSQVEEKILQSYDEEDLIKSDIEKEKKVVEEQEKVYLGKKKEVEDHLKLLEGRKQELQGQRGQKTEGIDGEILTRYERILENKSGHAIVPVENNSCGGCYMNVTPQMINVLKMGMELLLCEQCSRIIYYEEKA